MICQMHKTMASQESDDEMQSGSDQLLIDTSSSDDDDDIDLDDSSEDEVEGTAEEVEGDEEEDDDDEDEESDSDDKEEEEAAAGPSQAVASDSSDNGDPDCDRCPICLARLRDQYVGTPESCDHSFCLECIQEWAKNVNTCPVDRQPFNLIFARDSLDGVVVKKIEVTDRRLELEEEVVEDLTYCEMCGHANREDRLLLCDGCDLGYHCECLDPALDSVPVGEWFCPSCSTTERQQQELNTRPLVTQAQRRIGRTIVSERVRATIQQNRAQARRTSGSRSRSSEFDKDAVSSSSLTSVDSGESSDSESASARSKQGAAPWHRKKTKRRKQKRKATSKGKSKTAATMSSTGKKRTKRRRRRRRKTRKMCRTKDSVAPKTVKSRLAGRLGITTPPAGRTLPVKVSARSRALTVQRDIGIAPLTIMAGRDDLDPAWSDSELPAAPRGDGGSGIAVELHGGQSRYASSSRYTKAALNSWRPITRPHIRKLERQIECTAPVDLLGDILASQDRLNTNIDRVTIHRDGSLEVKPPEKKVLPSFRNHTRESPPNDAETTPTSGDNAADQQTSGGSSSDTAHAADNAQEVCGTTDQPSGGVGGSDGAGGDADRHGNEPHSGGCDAGADCVKTVSGKSPVEKKCDERKKNRLKMFDENQMDTSDDRTECNRDNSDDSCISCEGFIDDDMAIDGDASEMASNIDSDTPPNIDGDTPLNVDSDTHLNVNSDTCLNVVSDTPVNVDSDTRLNVDSDTHLNDDSDTPLNVNSDTPLNVDSDIAISVDTTTHVTSNDESCVSSDGDNQQQSKKELEGCLGGESEVVRQGREDIGLVCEDISSGAESIEGTDRNISQVVSVVIDEESVQATGNEKCDTDNDLEVSREEDGVSRVTGEDVCELQSSDKEGHDHEVTGDDSHELHESGEEGSVHEASDDNVREPCSSGEEASDREVVRDDVHELPGEEASVHEVTGGDIRGDESEHMVASDSVHESNEEGSDHEVVNEENHEEGMKEIEGSVGSEERTEILALLSDEADLDAKPGQEEDDCRPGDDGKPNYAHYENISEVEDEEQAVDGEESGGGSDEEGICEDTSREGQGSASMSLIMVPISELPRIPKKRKTQEVRLPTDGESPHSGVLERLNRPDKVDRYPKWEKRDRKDPSGGKSKVKQSDSGGSDVSQEKPRDDRSERRDEDTRRRHRNRSRSSSKERLHHHSKSSKHRHSHRRSRTPERERSRKRRDRSRERNRDPSRVSARSRSRSPRRRDESRSKRDRYDRPGKSRQKPDSIEYKGSVNMFSRSLKDVGNDADFGNRRFKLRRNSYKDFIPSEIVEPPKRPPSEKIETYEEKYRSRSRKNVYIEDNRIKVKASVDDLHDDSSSSSSDVIIIESDTETMSKNRLEKRFSDKPKVKSNIEKAAAGKTISDKPKVKSSDEQTSFATSGGKKLAEDTKCSRSPNRVTSQGRQTTSRSPNRVAAEGQQPLSRSPSRVPSQGRQTNSRSPNRVTVEGQMTRSPSRVSSEDRHNHLRLPMHGDVKQTRSQSPSRGASHGRLGVMDSTDSCYDPCHPTDSVSPSPPEDAPEVMELSMANVTFSTANDGQGDIMHPSLRMQTPMLTVDPRTMPPPMPGSLIIPPPPPPHMTFSMLGPGVRPPPFLVNNHMMGLEQFPSRFAQPRLSWQPMQLVQQTRQLVPVTRNGVPLQPPPHTGAESFAMDASALLSLQHRLPPRDDMGGMYHPPLPPMPPVNSSRASVLSLINSDHMTQFSTSTLPNFMSTMKTSRRSPGGGEGNAFKVPFPPNHPRVAFSMTSDNHSDAKQVGSESNEVVDMDVSSPLSDDLLESFTPPPFHDDDDDSKSAQRDRGLGGKGKEEVPGSAVELDKQEKYLKKLNRQERVVEEVKLAIKPFYAKGQISKDEYKDIMRKAVPKICHSKSGNINPVKIRSYVQAYVEKVQQLRKYKQKKQHDDVNGHKQKRSSHK